MYMNSINVYAYGCTMLTTQPVKVCMWCTLFQENNSNHINMDLIKAAVKQPM